MPNYNSRMPLEELIAYLNSTVDELCSPDDCCEDECHDDNTHKVDLVDRLTAVCDETLTDLIDGRIVLETVHELLALTQAVAIIEDLRDS